MQNLFVLLLLVFSFPVYAAQIHVATMSVGEWYQQATYPAFVNKTRYCAKHNYPFHFYTESLDTSRPIPWSKVLIILEIFEKHPECDYVFWTDADSLIMNDSIKLSRYIDKRYNIVSGTDFNGINTGQFLIRNCEWSKEFLLRVYANEKWINNGWWEQASVMDLLRNNHSDRKQVKLLKQRTMNSYAPDLYENRYVRYHEGDFIIHFAGVRGKALQDLMYKYYPITMDPALD